MKRITIKKTDIKTRLLPPRGDEEGRGSLSGKESHK